MKFSLLACFTFLILINSFKYTDASSETHQELVILTLDHIIEQSESVQEGMEAECLRLLNKFEDETDIPSGVVLPRHLSAAIRRGWWSCAHRIVHCLAELGLSFGNDFDMESRNINVHLNKMKSLILSARPNKQSISPAFQWAQSADEIFLQIKFAHKLDAPATIDIKEDEVLFKETKVVFKASKDNKAFSLELDLLSEIDPEGSSWSFGSVGTASVILKKKIGQRKWVRLLKSRNDYPANMHIWWSMQEHYDDELDKLPEDDGKQKKKEPSSETDNLNESAASENSESISPENKELSGERKKAPLKKKKKTKAELKAEKALKSKIKKIDEELKQKKKEIDDEAEERKKQLDEDYKSKKEELEAQWKEKKENTTNTQPAEVENVPLNLEEDKTSVPISWANLIDWIQENKQGAVPTACALFVFGFIVLLFSGRKENYKAPEAKKKKSKNN